MRNHYLKNSALRFWLILALIMGQGLPVSFAFAQSSADTVPVGNKIQTSESSAPSLLTGLTIDTNNPLKLNFIVDLGDSHWEGKEFEAEAKKLIKYFLTALTVPEEELWVNLSPYEKNRIIPNKLGQTEMGQNLLGQDYLLKQLTASLINPNIAIGRDFWKKVYDQAFKIYGKIDIPVNTFNRVWIVPDKAVIYEKWPTAMVVDTHLKVLMEEEYGGTLTPPNPLFKNEGENYDTFQAPSLVKEGDRGGVLQPNLSSQVFREIIIPAIEKEVNEGKSFESLRQIYHSMILATWFKQKLKASLLGQVYADQNKIKGIDNAEKQMKEKIYQQYLETFQKGLFNIIREEYDPHTDQMVPRKYMAGGWSTSNPVDGLNFAQRVSSQIIESEKGLSLKSSKALESGNKKSVDVLLLENASDATVASASVISSPKPSKVHFLFNRHTTFTEHLDKVRQQVLSANIIYLEGPFILEEIANRVSRGELNPNEGFQSVQRLAEEKKIGLLFPEIIVALLESIYRSGKMVYVENVYATAEGQKVINSKTKAENAWDEFLGSMLSGDARETRKEFLQYLEGLGDAHYRREKAMIDQMRDIQEKHPGLKTLVILGSAHTALYRYFQSRFQDIEVDREFLGENPVYPMDEAVIRDIIFQKFQLKAKKEPLPDSQVIAAIISKLLKFKPQNKNWLMINKISRRVSTSQQLENMIAYIHASPPPESSINNDGEFPADVVDQQIYLNLTNWLVAEKIATQEEIDDLKKDPFASSAVSSAVNEKTIKSILTVLEHRDYSAQELNAQNIDDLVILGNDQLETFRETLRLFQLGIGKRIYISGGYGRLTLPLIDKAVESGFNIQISEEQTVDAEDWQKIRAKGQEADIRKLVHQSEAEIIRQIMMLMVESEAEFAEVKAKFSNQDVQTFVVTERSQDKPENNSKNTFENLVLYREFLVAEGRLGKSQPFKILYIQTPHQQLRSKGVVDDVFASEMTRDQIQGISYTVSYQSENKSQEQIIKDLVGELWRLIMYSQIPGLRLQSPAYPQGLLSLPKDLWGQGLELFDQLAEDQKQKFAVSMLQLVSGFKIDLENLPANISEEAKNFVQRIIAAEKIEKKPTDTQKNFENEIGLTAQREGIALTPDTKIGLFIGGSHIVGGYYYKLFADVVRDEFGVDLAYLPCPIEIGDQNRVTLIKDQLKNNPQLVGAVITRPWKEEFSNLDSKIGAANFIVKDHATQQLNIAATDGQAWIDGLNHDLGQVYDFAGKKIVVVGAGGAARELAESLNAKGVAKISFVDVDDAKSRGLEKLTTDLKADYQVDFLSLTGNELNLALKEADIVINATGIGREKTKGKSPLSDKTSFHAGQIVCDLISNERTRFLNDAASRGVKQTFNGRSMFIYGMVGFMREWLKQMGEENVPSDSEMFTSISNWLNDHDHSFANTLSNLRQKRGLSQVDLASRMHVSPLEISRWENGMRFPQSKHFRKLIRILGEDLLLASEFTVIKEDSLGVAIKKLRLRKGLTQGELAEKMRNGMDASTISRWENDGYSPSLNDLVLLINILGQELLFIDEFKVQKESQASSSAVDQTELKYGGINLNPRYLNLQIKRDNQGIPLPLIQQPINRMQIEGFIPIIINIVPVNVPRLLSENKKGESQDLHLVSN